ncbi:transcriptional regulator ATRX homolog, partial [Stegodyphus dumicola]|uniref:transcriptional regulator ATRX homolog n=1 Tax=Stegodyphus dumicola TaxID=202533 RepID=UPI0015A78805
MLSFVKPYLLGTAKEFRNRFVNPIINGQYDDSTAYDVKIMKKRIHILHKLLDGCVQRCDYSALTKFLPPKHEFVISVKLSDVQIKMYRWYLENKSQRNLEKKQGSTLFNDYNVMRNLCIHPYICHTQFLQQEKRRLLRDDDEDMSDFINDESESEATSKEGTSSDEEEVIRTYKTRRHQAENSETESEPEPEKQWYHEFISEEDKNKIELSGKMVLLVDIIKECEAIGDKIVVFSQSLLTLDMVEVILQYLDQQTPSDLDMQRDAIGSWISGVDYFRMDGSTSADFRKSFIDKFNDRNNERARLFLISTKAGSLGTNLIGANRVVILDASWNPSHDVQAIFRVYRFGQIKPVYIYRLLAQGTMEEKIYDRQVTKLSLSIRVVDEQQIDRHFNAAELAELYTFNPDSTSNRPTPMVPNDRLLAEMLIRNKDWIVTYHVHDSLLQNETEEDLTEEERKAAWEEYENEREGRTTANIVPGIQNLPGYQGIFNYYQEPNFDEADYQGPLIPTVQKIMSDLTTHINKQYPHASAFQKNCQLLRSVHAIRAAFQEKHVKIIRMKQEV